jgi:uncharacterized protein YyaL (SSP411 family)
VAGDQRSPQAVALRQAASRPHVPDLVLTALDEGDPQASWPLYVGKVARDGMATAYACRGYACDEPTADPERLTAQVASLATPPTAA